MNKDSHIWSIFGLTNHVRSILKILKHLFKVSKLRRFVWIFLMVEGYHRYLEDQSCCQDHKDQFLMLSYVEPHVTLLVHLSQFHCYVLKLTRLRFLSEQLGYELNPCIQKCISKR